MAASASRRDVRWHASAPDKRDVVDVVSRGRRERPVLTPAGHAPVHESWIAREANVGPESKSLGNAGAIPFEQHVGALDTRLQQRIETGGCS